METAAILCNAGFAALSINYRLNEPALGGMTSADAVAWPENLADCLVALDWVCSGGGQQWKLDSQRVAMIGFSAGGHLAMHAAARRSDRVRCLVNFYGPGRLTGRLAETFLNFQPDVTGETLAAAQVHPLLGTGFPPVLLTHGTDDSLVPVEDSRWLADEIRRAGARCVYREIPGAPHGFTMSWGDGSLANAILAFLKQFTND